MSAFHDWLLARLRGEDAAPPGGHEAPAGAFVQVRVEGALRGFLGTLARARPFHETALEVARLALGDDPRFPPARPGDAVVLRVWRTSAPRPVSRPEDVRAGVDGVSVRLGFHRGVHLPGLDAEQDLDASAFLESACIAAGLGPEGWRREGVSLLAFEATEIG